MYKLNSHGRGYPLNFFFFVSSGGWGKIKLWLTTLPRIFIRVVCRFNSVAFAAQRFFHSCQILSPSETSFIVSAHRLTSITLLTLILHCSCKGSRRSISLTRTHNRYYARSKYHTQLAKMSFDRIFDLTAGAYFIFITYTGVVSLPTWVPFYTKRPQLGCCHSHLT